MKIGRNKPCPCGSGKKYKNCCIDKTIRQTSNANTIPIEEEKSDFEYIRATAKDLGSIISAYNVRDVVRAVFCINSWPSNRSALAQTLTLNQAISDTRHFGDKRIDDYEAFMDFFNAISTYLPITNMEDPTLSDFGEVKIIFDGEFFPVILGTGHELVFGALNYLPALATILEMTAEVKSVLQYNRLIIDRLTNHISTSRGDYEIKFEVPPPPFWNATFTLLASKEFMEHANRAHFIMGYQKCPIEMRHFFIHKGEWHPLYNASILVDFYKMLLSYATEKEFHMHIRLTIKELLEGTFNASDTTRSRVLIEPRAIDTDTGKPYTNNRLAFITVSGTRVLVAINLGHFTDESSVMTEIQKITFLHKNNRLGFVESHYRKEICGGYGGEIKSENSINYLLVEPHTDITSKGGHLGSHESVFRCSALDLIYILGFMDSFDELLEFIRYDSTEDASVLSFGGKSSLFFTWKNSHRHIQSGAVKYEMIFVQHGTSDDYVFTHYTKNLFNYPFSIQSEMFSTPLAWETQAGESHGFTEFRHKGCFEWVGDGKMLGPSIFVFFTHDITSFRKQDFSQQNITLLKTIGKLNRSLFDSYAPVLCAEPLFKNKILQIIFTPARLGLDGTTSQFLNSKIHTQSNRIVLSYSVDASKLLSAIENVKDRSVECEYFLELMKPFQDLSPSFFTALERMADDDSSLDKRVDVLTIKQNYYYSDKEFYPTMEQINFTRAKKKIAEVCFAAGIKPGIYHGKNATNIVRELQTEIVPLFEDMLKKYNGENLHLMTLSYYATQIHGSMISLKRYKGFRTLEPAYQQEFDSLTKKTREDFKRNARTALYMLESNLARGNIKETNQCEESEFADLLALADWLVTLQENSDISFFTELDVSLEVDNEFKINTVLSEITQSQHKEILSRKYDQREYGLKDDSVDEDHLLKCADAFLKDTGVEFSMLLSLLAYLKLTIVDSPFVTEVHPNVFEAHKEDLVDGFLALTNNPEHGHRGKVYKVLEFITLDCNKLKCLDGKRHDVLPVWDREKRNNRFEVRPLLAADDKYVFSPFAIAQLEIFWKYGLLEWYPPFEIGLDNLKNELEKWKSRYEDEMVKDIANLFEEAGFEPVYQEFEFISRFPQDDFPDIGDYDVIAINHPKREIYLIESKVLQKVGSVFEDQMQQKGFFFNNKDDEKFQRRIDFMKNNRANIGEALGFDLTEYVIVSYMVTNKLFLSRYKPIDFPIITYHELGEKLLQY